MSSLNVIILGGERQLIEKIFPNEEKKNVEKREIRYNITKNSMFKLEDVLLFKIKHENLSFKWRAIIYPELNKENYKEIRKELKDYFDKEEKEIKKNVIIFFGDNKITTIIKLINNLEQTKRPLILFISKNKSDYSQFYDIRLVTYLKQDNDSEKIYNKIVSYLWEKDCYFNERGNKTCKLSTANLFYKKPKGFTFLKILLIGLKRSGKSTLINLISKKLTSFELPNDQSVTKKITEYEVYPFEEEEKNNITSIKLWDTPGIEKTTSFNSESLVIDFLEEKFDEINLIYFLKKDGAIEDCKKVFEKIISLNKNRIKKGLAKIPIIFIINGVINVQGEKTSVAINTVKDYLTNNFGNDLYDKEEKEENDDDSDDDEYDRKKQYEDGNIIKVNLRRQQDEFSYQAIYGIDKLFKKSLVYLKSINTLKAEDLNELKETNRQLINIFKDDLKRIKIDKEKYNILMNRSKELTSKMMKENSLLMSMPILHKFYEKSDKYICFIILGVMSLIYLMGIPLIIYGIVKLVKGVVLQVALEYGFDEKDIQYYKLEEYVFSEIKENNEKEINKKMEKAKDFFDKVLRFTNGNQLFIKSFEIYQNVFKSLEKLGNINNEEWNRFSENEI